MTDEDERDDRELWKRYRASRSKANRDALVVHYTWLARHLANSLHVKIPARVDTEDLMADGVIGLIEAVQSFDPGREIKFRTFATWRINGAMYDSLRHYDWVPRSIRIHGKAVRRALEKHGEDMTVEEIAEEIKLPVKDLRELAVASTVRLFAMPEAGLANFPGKQSEGTVVPQHHDETHSLLKGLTTIEMRIVDAYYFESLDMPEIGRREGLTGSRIAQIHDRMLRRLSKRLLQSGFNPDPGA
ncbi:MAG: sigma-70 family RNA polymerase sigma factor [Planctomycetota bacterium]